VLLLEVIDWTGQLILWVAETVVWMVSSILKAKKSATPP
jgi:hypothetical protein